VSTEPSILAAEFPPSIHDFFPPGFAPWGGGNDWFTKTTLMLWVATAVIIIFFLVAYRDPQMVPTKRQWLAEAIYGFGRNSIARDMIGTEGLRFAPYLTCLFCFIFVMNVFAIIPFFQISPNSHFAFPLMLAVISYLLFNYVGIRKHGFWRYMKMSTIPPAPWYILPLLVPIEFASTFLIRPFSLSVRLFANMFAGHMLLLVFTLGGFAMINAHGLLAPVSVLSWLLTIALTFLEFLVVILQAYVFTVLTASYVQGALADEH
jgi:F-type H+-transporting ATPase subunit a